jgi:hypothetical protein
MLSRSIFASLATLPCAFVMLAHASCDTIVKADATNAATSASTRGATDTARAYGPANTAPSVNAGADDDATEDVAYTLNATVTDDGLPGAMVCQWTTSDDCTFEDIDGGGALGDGECTGESDDCDLDVTCGTVETATLNLECDDGALTDDDDVVLNVEAAATAWWSRVPAFTTAMKESIPFHASMAIPDEPVTTSTDTCTDATTCNADLAVAGRHVTITSSFTGDLSVTASNTTLSSDAGIVVTGTLTIGTTALITNVLIDGKGGSTGTANHSCANRLRFNCNAANCILSGGTRLYSDIIIDGIVTENAAAPSAGAFSAKWEDSAIINTTSHAAGWGIHTNYQPTNAPWIGLLILSNSVLTDSATSNGSGLRLGNGNGAIDDVREIVLWGNYVRTVGATYQTNRLNSVQNFMAMDNIFTGAGTAGCHHIGNLAGDILGNVYVWSNSYYDTSSSSCQYGAGTGPDLFEFHNNDVHGGFSEAQFDTEVSDVDVGDTVTKTGSTWGATTTHPAWPDGTGGISCDATAL